MEDNNKSASPIAAEREEKQASTAISLLKELEDILHSKIKQKKEQVHKTKNIAQNDRLSIEIDTLHWVLSQSLSIKRLLKGQESELRYDTTITITKELMIRGE